MWQWSDVHVWTLSVTQTNAHSPQSFESRGHYCHPLLICQMLNRPKETTLVWIWDFEMIRRCWWSPTWTVRKCFVLTEQLNMWRRLLTMSKLHKPIEADFGHLQKPFAHIWWFASEFLHLKTEKSSSRHSNTRAHRHVWSAQNKQNKTKPKKNLLKTKNPAISV